MGMIVSTGFPDPCTVDVPGHDRMLKAVRCYPFLWWFPTAWAKLSKITTAGAILRENADPSGFNVEALISPSPNHRKTGRGATS
ncbi:hypothetical protein JS562_23770, partial [Agrobacterium sp. S2]|nr:hypothetical protein [Agrobacterium sp. S2]